VSAVITPSGGVSDATMRELTRVLAESLFVIKRQGDLLAFYTEAIPNKKLAEFYGVSVWTIGRWRAALRNERRLWNGGGK